jgi:hypothetical protein
MLQRRDGNHTCWIGVDAEREAAMRENANQRFDARSVDRLATVHEGRRFEMKFCSSDGQQMLVSVPLQVAVELGCTICDISVHAPYLIGGVRVKPESVK